MTKCNSGLVIWELFVWEQLVRFYMTENGMPKNQQASENEYSHHHHLAFRCLGRFIAGSDERSGNRTSKFKQCCETTGIQSCTSGYRLSKNTEAFPLPGKTILSLASVTTKFSLTVQVIFSFTGKIASLISGYSFSEC